MLRYTFSALMLILGLALALTAGRFARTLRGHVWRQPGTRPLNALGRGLALVHLELGACSLLALGLPHWLLPPAVEYVAVWVFYGSLALNAALLYLVTWPATGLGVTTSKP